MFLVPIFQGGWVALVRRSLLAAQPEAPWLSVLTCPRLACVRGGDPGPLPPPLPGRASRHPSVRQLTPCQQQRAQPLPALFPPPSPLQCAGLCLLPALHELQRCSLRLPYCCDHRRHHQLSLFLVHLPAKVGHASCQDLFDCCPCCVGQRCGVGCFECRARFMHHLPIWCIVGYICLREGHRRLSGSQCSHDAVDQLASLWSPLALLHHMPERHQWQSCSVRRPPVGVAYAGLPP